MKKMNVALLSLTGEHMRMSDAGWSKFKYNYRGSGGSKITMLGWRRELLLIDDYTQEREVEWRGVNRNKRCLAE